VSAAASLGPRKLNRGVLRAHVEALRRTNQLSAVLALCSPKVVAILQNPRAAPAWLGGDVYDEINDAVYQLHGRAGLRRFLVEVMQSGLIKVLEPLIQFAFKFVGSGPPALLSRSDLLLSLNTRDIEMEWKQTSAGSGEMIVRFGDWAPPTAWMAWEGVFIFLLQIANATGTVGEAVPLHEGYSARIDVRWISTASRAEQRVP
jgi:hypothetical protein